MNESEQLFENEWKSKSCLSEISMGDFYSGRQYILKYLPWHGKILEAGCGLGRYVFYLSDLGFDVEGVDASWEAISKCKAFSEKNGYSPDLFRREEITRLSYADNSLSAYISLGILEHFRNGPESALREAHRILSPGGIMIITMPSANSLEYLISEAIRKIKNAGKYFLRLFGIKKGIIHTGGYDAWRQHWFTPQEMKEFVTRAGFRVCAQDSIDLRYAVYSILPSATTNSKVILRTILPLIDALERVGFGIFGGNSVIICAKEGYSKSCFLCGDTCRRCHGDYIVAVCEKCLRETRDDILKRYLFKNRKASFDGYEYLSDRVETNDRICDLCGKTFQLNSLFGDYGFIRSACPDCLKNVRKRSQLIYSLKSMWQLRKQINSVQPKSDFGSNVYWKD